VVDAIQARFGYKLKHGKWMGNSIIDFVIWKLLDMLVKLGIKDVLKRFKIMDSWFMYYMFVQNERYDFDACRRWVTKKDVNSDGHVLSFMSHELMFVPVNMDNVHWILFVICPENREMIVIDSLYDPISQYHISMYRNLVHFIQEYQRKKRFHKKSGHGI
jgi:Ulp1 family protease